MSGLSVLVIEDNKHFLLAMRGLLSHNYQVRTARTASEALQLIQPTPDAILLDLRLDENRPEERDGLKLLESFRKEIPYCPVLVITAFGDIETAVKCMKMGAVDFIQKGGDDSEILARIVKAIENARLTAKVEELRASIELIEPRKIMGSSDSVSAVKDLIKNAARDGNVTVLISGETGTGKEIAARAIHATGARGEMPFVAVDSVGLPEQTIQSELFGHEAGAFTDAKMLHVGYAERANKGILFLDEIGDLSPDIQVKLLRFLEEKAFYRLGGKKEIQVDVQIIAATNADLISLSHVNKFRADLLYRLKVFEIRMPPLRSHLGDIPELCQYFLALFNAKWKGPTNISADAVESLQRFDWPGNVRQLRNVVEAARIRAIHHGRTIIFKEDLPGEIETAYTHRFSLDGKSPHGVVNLELELARRELQIIEEAMAAVGRRKTMVWQLVGLNDRFALRRRIVNAMSRFPALKTEYVKLAQEFRLNN